MKKTLIGDNHNYQDDQYQVSDNDDNYDDQMTIMMRTMMTMIKTWAIVRVAAWAIFLLGQRNAWHSNVSFLVGAHSYIM